MKRSLVYGLDELVPTWDSIADGPAEIPARDLEVGDPIFQSGRRLRVAGVTVNGQVRVQAED